MLDKWARLFRIIKQNGGLVGTWWKRFRFDTLKEGRLVGWDCMGNRYWENNYYMIGRNRWVEYADSVNWDYDASQVSAEWYGWLHYKTDRLPCDDPAKQDLYESTYTAKWLLPHAENFTATNRAYYPYKTTPTSVQVWNGSSIHDRCTGK